MQILKSHLLPCEILVIFQRNMKTAFLALILLIFDNDDDFNDFRGYFLPEFIQLIIYQVTIK